MIKENKWNVCVFQTLVGLMSFPRSDIHPLFCVSPSLNDHFIHDRNINVVLCALTNS